MVPTGDSLGRTLQGFPRTRGDGPSPGGNYFEGVAVPPHPRGWSLSMTWRLFQNLGSPAPAGMVPKKDGFEIEGDWFPRTRGDGPPHAGGRALTRSVPPHPRGWSLGWRLHGSICRGSPAPAGMVPRSLPKWLAHCRFPRTRGDGPHIRAALFAPERVPPHPRGWSQRRARSGCLSVGSPAPAGMVRRSLPGAAASGRFPRTRGDGPRPGTPLPFKAEVPPHPRGWSLKRG